jgi:hypothetical protein
MTLITPWSLLLGLVMASPALAQAWSEPSGDLGGAVLRFVLATVVAGAGLLVVGGLVDHYRSAVDAADTPDEQEPAVELEEGAATSAQVR